MMRSFVAATAATVLFGLAGCGPGTTRETAAADAPADMPETAETEPVAAPSAAAAAEVKDVAGDTPPFAAIYPGGRVDQPATLAEGTAGPGGLVTFVSEAPPETIIAFYRERAEAAGLSSVMAMNQGDASAYGAAEAHQTGASLQVVAAPLDDGQTSVQLTWNAGA